MRGNEPAFTIGVEEEYLLVDKETRALVVDPPPTLMAEAEAICGAQVTSELLRSQIEVGTKVCKNVQEVRADLSLLRRNIIQVADRHGLAPIAASTHPFSSWTEQKHTEKDRYKELTLEMQGAARRMVICGMHIHVGIGDDELRIDLMNQLSYFLPHLLALSCSSPFWNGRDTGLKSYRLTIFDSLPRTGLPERFASWAKAFQIQHLAELSIATDQRHEDAAADIANATFDFALGLGTIRTAELGHKRVVMRQILQPWMEAMQSTPVGVALLYDGLHIVVQRLHRHTAKGIKGLLMTIAQRLETLVGDEHTEAKPAPTQGSEKQGEEVAPENRTAL